ncbi:MAG: hypothetical protein B7Y83_12290 [Flavobacteriales bacterium 32-34-25]|nr:MAG: hypothetical protein B7Y83_12290 [Flavobacteriales bacterium 32-34-25]
MFFDGGDTFHGTLPVVISRGEALIPILSELGFSAMVGHWDFTYKPEHLLALDKLLNYPVLSVNAYKDDGTLLRKPYSFIEIGGQKIAVIDIYANIIDKTMPVKLFCKKGYVAFVMIKYKYLMNTKDKLLIYKMI